EQVTLTVNDINGAHLGAITTTAGQITFNVSDAALTNTTPATTRTATEGLSIGNNVVLATFRDANPYESGSPAVSGSTIAHVTTATAGDLSVSVNWGGNLVAGNS